MPLCAMAQPMVKSGYGKYLLQIADGEGVLMEVTTTALAGVLIVQPKVFADARGFFLESFNQRQFDAAVGAPVSFVQDNHSRSAQGVLRGLHMQVGAARRRASWCG